MKKYLIVAICVLFPILLYGKTRKVVYVVLDGIPADYIERVHPKYIYDIASQGGYARAYTGGEIGGYSQTPTISAIGYMNILTGTWMNKHNVDGNSNLKPNYNYWSLFRIAKEQKKNYTTAIFSGWTDNRTVLIGEGKKETDYLKIDYVFDGYDNDKVNFPQKKDELQIFDIDSVVSKAAADCIRKDAPDLSWIYLWYTDSGFHIYGDGSFMDQYVNKTDELVGQIWEAVKYREKHFDEEWMIIVTTDHGRGESGHHHGGQLARERSVWISTNCNQLNEQFRRPTLALVDILPSVCRFMGFDMPREVAFEQDGISFYGATDIYNLTTHPYDNLVKLNWQSDKPDEEAVVYMSVTNHYKDGGKDQWMELGCVKASSGQFVVDLSKYPASKFYKFVVKTPNTILTRWVYK